ncbi:CRTAC1 family protein [Enhygromyxa salina]|uniref:CRTAC1 family protein n=1 Tax=Enhygromyxa salina TaxID=215803 RepID=UPI0015E5CC6F|nr:CRTAC1 family protein [Enhygromyxa salina]
MTSPCATPLAAASIAALTLACKPEPPAPEQAPPRSLFDEAEAPSEPTNPAEPATAPQAPSSGRALQFSDVTKAWGVDLRHHAGRNPDRWIPEIMNGGVALIDVNRDGALDLFLADGGQLAGSAEPGVGPRLLLGDGHGAFTDVSEAWGLRHQGYGMGVSAGDIDGDGWIDLYLTSFDAQDRLLRNDAGQGFVDVSAAWGVDPRGWSTSAAFLDADSDGDLDLYVVRYIRYTLADSIKCWFRTIHVYCTPAMYEALPDLLYRNEGGRFTDVSAEAGIDAHPAKGLALATGDLDDDGDTDLYVANDTSRNLLLVNDGRGRFEEAGVASGVAFSQLGREEASMGVAVSDSNADGRWDLAVTNFQSEPTSLYTRRDNGSYRERSDAAGIGASARARLSFGIEWIDVDNDGDEDLLTANGHIADNVESYREQVRFAQQNSLYERVADGRFVDVSDAAGDALAYRGVSRGLAVGDIDGDGGLDYVVVDNDGPVQIARNTTADRGHFISLWLEGSSTNRGAIGARVSVSVGGQTLVREVRGASSYLSVSDRRIHLGLGEATRVEEVTIRWPGGEQQQLGPLDADTHYRVVEGSAAQAYVPGAEVLQP